ncbi:family 88 glycosyl hydrolase [Amanita muscaria]
MEKPGVLTLLISAAIIYSEAVALENNPFPFSPGFDIQKVANLAQRLPSHSWEYGTATEALLEVYDPLLSVFGDKPFPVPNLTPQDSRSLAYAVTKFKIGQPPSGLLEGGGAAGDPASLGVAAVMLSTTNKTLASAAKAEISYLTKKVPRWWNGAISHRADVAELWADFVYMAPPFIAYYGAAHDDISLLHEAVNQVANYQQVLLANRTSQAQIGSWVHIVGPQSADPGLWSTGNAWAAAGMLRVLATIQKAPVARQDPVWLNKSVRQMSFYIQQILDAAIRSPAKDGLLINYWNDGSNKDGRGYGEISGTSMLAAVAYRMATLKFAGLPDVKIRQYISWADNMRKIVGGLDSKGNPHITANGIATPAVNPLNWYDTKPFTTGSPEGNNFVVLMYAAWRDCVNAGICKR